MRSKFSFVALLVAAVFTLSSCSRDEDMTPVQPGETVTYKDMVYKFSFKAPKAWVVESQPGKRTTYYTTQGAGTRFTKFTEGDYGARVEVGSEENTTMETAAESFKNQIENVLFDGPKQTTLGGKPAIRYDYKVKGDDPDGYVGYRIFGQQDSVMTYFDAATFGAGRLAKYRPVFDLAEKSVTLGYVQTSTPSGEMDSAAMARMMEEQKPSETMKTYDGQGFTISYPENFSAGGTGKGVAIKGDRNDATIQVDILDGKNTTFDKFVAENATKVYRGAGVGNATLGGQAGKVINYSFNPTVKSRAYFVMKGDKIYRLTVNWPTAMEDAFRPAFERSIASFKLK